MYLFQHLQLKQQLAPSAAGSIGNWPFEEGAASIVGAAISVAPVNAGLGLAGF